MVKRTLRQSILARLKQFPAVALLGPRQCGKTTLAKTVSYTYFDLELDQERLRLDLQWDDLARSDSAVILDEAQNYPELFPRLRSVIDQNRKKNGRFLILGSVSPGLMKQTSEFLTGRIAVCELSPFSAGEVKNKGLDNLWLMGGFPDGGILPDGGMLDESRFPVWQKNYLDLLAMRDLPSWGLPATPRVTLRLFKMLAIANGTIWNASQIGKSMGLSYHTINFYLNYLEQTYLIRRLQPYFSNIRKRLVKSPKIYWRDTGLLHALLGVDGFDSLLAQPWVGLSWEGWIIEQILMTLGAANIQHEAFFFRSSDGYELDLLLKIKSRLWGIEIKLTAAPGREEMERLKKSAAMAGCDEIMLISRTKKEISAANVISTNITGALKRLV